MRILYVEPYEGGSHALFTRTLTEGIDAEWTTITLPGRHWKWRMRGSAVTISLEHAEAIDSGHDLLLCSSFLPLAELTALSPAVAKIPRVVYFHENQFVYPTRGEPSERDFHFAFTQLVTCLSANVSLFNSAYNRDTLLREGKALLQRMPDARPRGWISRIQATSQVMPFPLALPDEAPNAAGPPAEGPLILWNHRWEHDKDPAAFFAALAAVEAPFRLAVCGAQFDEVPPAFAQAEQRFADKIVHWGHLDSRQAYEDLLRRADIVVSTAQQEFFGVSVLEAIHFGARPLVPDRLAYQETVPEAYRYRDETDLVARLTTLCHGTEPLRADRRDITRPFLANNVLPRFEALFRELTSRSQGPLGRFAWD